MPSGIRRSRGTAPGRVVAKVEWHSVELFPRVGFVVTNATNAITVSLADNPGGSTLGGTTTVNAVGGYVTFSKLTLNKKGKGYLIRISGTGLTSTKTDPFNVT